MRAVTFDCPINHHSHKTGSIWKPLGTETGFDRYSCFWASSASPPQSRERHSDPSSVKELSTPSERFFTMVWPHDAARQLVSESGTENWFWLQVMQSIVSTMLAVWAFVRLARESRPGALSEYEQVHALD